MTTASSSRCAHIVRWLTEHLKMSHHETLAWQLIITSTTNNPLDTRRLVHKICPGNNETYSRALCMASYNDNFSIVCLLLHNTSVNGDCIGDTDTRHGRMIPLAAACSWGYHSVAKLLALRTSAKYVNMETEIYKDTALHLVYGVTMEK